MVEKSLDLEHMHQEMTMKLGNNHINALTAEITQTMRLTAHSQGISA